MARSLNKVTLIGNIVRDPALRTTTSGTSVVNFTVATNRSYTDSSGEFQERAEFHSVVAWSKLAEICSKLLNKGDKVYIEGRLESDKYTDKSGVERTGWEVVANEMILLKKPSDNRLADDAEEVLL